MNYSLFYNMRNNQREKLIASVGVETANKIESIERDIESIFEYLDVAKVYSTRGFTLQKQNLPMQQVPSSGTSQGEGMMIPPPDEKGMWKINSEPM